MTPSENWFPNPASLDSIQTDWDGTNLTIWQNLGDTINSIHLDRHTARDIATWILDKTRPNQPE